MILIQNVFCKSMCKLNQGEAIFHAKEKYKEVEVFKYTGKIEEEEFICYTSIHDDLSYAVQKYLDKKGRKSEFYSTSQVGPKIGVDIREIDSLKDLLFEVNNDCY